MVATKWQAVMFGIAAHPKFGDGWTCGKTFQLGGKKVEEEGKESQHPWRRQEGLRQEGLRESSSCGRWTNRQCEQCHEETLGTSECMIERGGSA